MVGGKKLMTNIAYGQKNDAGGYCSDAHNTTFKVDTDGMAP